MVLNSYSGLAGDRSLLTSKLIKLDEGGFITFDAYFNPAANSPASLVLELNHLGIKKQIVANIGGSNSWQRLRFAVPPGEFHVNFRGNIGEPFSEEIAVANVNLLTSKHDNVPNATREF